MTRADAVQHVRIVPGMYASSGDDTYVVWDVPTTLASSQPQGVPDVR